MRLSIELKLLGHFPKTVKFLEVLEDLSLSAITSILFTETSTNPNFHSTFLYVLLLILLQFHLSR